MQCSGLEEVIPLRFLVFYFNAGWVVGTYRAVREVELGGWGGGNVDVGRDIYYTCWSLGVYR